MSDTPQPGDRFEHVPTGEKYTYLNNWFSYARLRPDGDLKRTKVVWMPDLLEGKQWRREETESHANH